MAFAPDDSFKLNPDVLYVEDKTQIRLTFATLEDKLYEINELAKDVFLMAIQDFSYAQMIEVCQQTKVKEGSADAEVEKLLLKLIEMNILVKNP